MDTIKHIIDLDAEPFCPYDYVVVEHQKGGQCEWSASKVTPYLFKEQRTGCDIRGTEIRERLKQKLVYNANLLDYLLKNRDLIPEEWKGKRIFFWGTIYRTLGGSLCVRGLCWRGSKWHWQGAWLHYGWHDSEPAAIVAG